MGRIAYDVQAYLSQQGMAGYTMVMDTTVLQGYLPDHAQKLSMYFVAHAHGDPEWLRGGFVYTAQKYTSPSMGNLTL